MNNKNNKRRREISALIKIKREEIKTLDREIRELQNEYYNRSACGFRLGAGRKGKLPFDILSTRLSNALKKGGLTFWKDLRRISSRDLLTIPGFGKRSLCELQEVAEKKFTSKNPKYRIIKPWQREIYDLNQNGKTVSEIVVEEYKAEPNPINIRRIERALQKVTAAMRHNIRLEKAYREQE